MNADSNRVLMRSMSLDITLYDIHKVKQVDMV